MELSNDREMAVDDAAFIHCWGLPAADSEEADLITIGDSVSQHSMDAHMPVSELVLTSHVSTDWMVLRVKDEQVAWVYALTDETWKMTSGFTVACM